MADAAQKVVAAVQKGERNNMSILINKNTQVITQGITGKTGQFHTKAGKEYANGKNCFVAGVTPKKGGQSFRRHPDFRHGEGSQGSRPAPTSR